MLSAYKKGNGHRPEQKRNCFLPLTQGPRSLPPPATPGPCHRLPHGPGDRAGRPPPGNEWGQPGERRRSPPTYPRHMMNRGPAAGGVGGWGVCVWRLPGAASPSLSSRTPHRPLRQRARSGPGVPPPLLRPRRAPVASLACGASPPPPAAGRREGGKEGPRPRPSAAPVRRPPRRGGDGNARPRPPPPPALPPRPAPASASAPARPAAGLQGGGASGGAAGRGRAGPAAGARWRRGEARGGGALRAGGAGTG